MDNAGYTTLSRQTGLLRAMSGIANNIANMSTTGYRREGVMFSEYVRSLDDAPSLSMAAGRVREVDMSQGAMTQTGGDFDIAIQGEGFFLVQTPAGDRLTRAGAFVRTATGELATPEGHPLLDAGGTPVFAPPQARSIAIAPDGTLSADGEVITQIGLWEPNDPKGLERAEGVSFTAPDGVRPAAGASLHQGFLEASNADPVREVTRMIEVQRAYELGQNFLERDDERIRAVVRTLGTK